MNSTKLSRVSSKQLSRSVGSLQGGCDGTVASDFPPSSIAMHRCIAAVDRGITDSVRSPAPGNRASEDSGLEADDESRVEKGERIDDEAGGMYDGGGRDSESEEEE